jgi:hypothetical protein
MMGMRDPVQSLAELNLAELNECRLAFSPNDARTLYGAVAVPPGEGERYAYVMDYTVVLYREEQHLAGQLNIEIEQGATFGYTFFWRNVDGTPVDLTGALAKLSIRAEKLTTSDHKATIASYAYPAGGETPWFNSIDITDEEGKVVVTLTPAETPQIEAGEEWYYDLILTLSSGEVHRLVEGQVKVDPGVTT